MYNSHFHTYKNWSEIPVFFKLAMIISSWSSLTGLLRSVNSSMCLFSYFFPLKIQKQQLHISEISRRPFYNSFLKKLKLYQSNILVKNKPTKLLGRSCSIIAHNIYGKFLSLYDSPYSLLLPKIEDSSPVTI